jgi:IclR family transcriptional regulator, acetate operon repressor
MSLSMRRGQGLSTATVAGTTGTQAISRTLSVLDLFQQRGADLGITEIAEQLALSASTVHRLVRALVDRGYLAQNEETDRYYLGRSAVLLGQAANQGLGLHRVHLVLERMREQTGESVNLGVRDGDEMVVVLRSESKHALRFSQEPGSRLPVHATAMGKAYLSHGSLTIEKEVAALGRPLRALTARTITTGPKLREELNHIRRRGYSIDDEEAIAGVRCVAAPILTPQAGLLAAVAIQAPAVRMARTRLKELSSVVRRSAEEIAHLMPASHHL